MTGGLCVNLMDHHILSGFTNGSISDAVWKNTALLNGVGDWAEDEHECAQTCVGNPDCKSFAFDPTKKPSYPSASDAREEKVPLSHLFKDL